MNQLKINISKTVEDDHITLYDADLNIHFGRLRFKTNDSATKEQIFEEFEQRAIKDVFGEIGEKIKNIIEEGRFNRPFLNTDLLNKLQDLQVYYEKKSRIEIVKNN